MHIILCIKQVPDTSDMRIDPATNNLIREGVPSVVNPTDLNAAEEALKIKDAYDGKISVLTMGPPQAEQALRDILSMGADRGVLISDRSFAGADTLATSYALWKGIQRIVAEDGPFDLVLFGKQAIDGETGQVPPGVAVRLGIPIITYVNRIERFDPANRVIRGQRKVDDGSELVESVLPAALTVSEECNRPRQSTIDGILKAKRTKIEVWNKDAVKADPKKIGLTGSPTFVRKVFVPPPKKSGEIRQASSGNTEETVKWLVDQLLKKGILGQKKGIPQPADAHQRVPQTAKKSKQPSRGDIWVYVEHRFGVPRDVSWELMAEGQRIADTYGFNLAAVVLGDDVSNVIQDAFAHGAERVYTVSNHVLGAYRTKPYAEALTSLIRKHKPEALLVGASPNGRDLVGAVVTMVETGAIADCTMIDVDEKFGVQGTRPDFGGKEMSTIVCPKHRPIALTVRPRVFRAAPADYSRKGDVVYEEVPLDESSVPTRVLDFVETRKMGVKLESAPVIVAGGRGLGSPKNLPLLEDLAKSLGGVVGATRAIVYLGWIAKDYQIGQTGYTVRPRLYVAVGLSGAIQHVVGMQNSDVIVAINKDAQAPIFSVTDFGIVGDLFEVVPAFMKELKNRGLDERSRHG